MARTYNTNDERADIYGFLDEQLDPPAQRSMPRVASPQRTPAARDSQRSSGAKTATPRSKTREVDAEEEPRKQPPARRRAPTQQPATEYAKGAVTPPLPPARPPQEVLDTLAPLPPARPAELDAPPLPPARPRDLAPAAEEAPPVPPQRPTREVIEPVAEQLPENAPPQAAFVKQMNASARSNQLPTEQERGVEDDSFFGDPPAAPGYRGTVTDAMKEVDKLQAAGIDPSSINTMQRVRMNMMGIDKWIAEQQMSGMYKQRRQTEQRARGAQAARM